MAVRGLFLDFDGLICDTERAAHQSWQELYAGNGLEFPYPVWSRMAGHRDGEAIAAADLSARLGRPLDAGVLHRRRGRKAQLCNAEPARPGVAALLDLAAAHGIALTVVSSSPVGWVSGHLLRLGLRDRFAGVLAGPPGTPPKPAPDLYEAALARTGYRPADLLAIEDSPAGVSAALAAGLRCVAVPNAVGRRAAVRHATLVLDSLADPMLALALELGLEGAASR